MTNSTHDNASKKPTHIVKMRHGKDDEARFEKIGVAWQRDNGTIYTDLVGQQIISTGFYLFPVSSSGSETGQ